MDWLLRLAALIVVFALVVAAAFYAIALGVGTTPQSATASASSGHSTSLPDCTEAQKPSGNGGGGAVDQPLPGEEIDDSERPILYKLRTPSERKFLDGYAPHFQPDLSWERPRPDPRVSERSTHDSIANCIVSSTSIVLKKLDELRRLVSETGTELEIEILGIKLRVDLLICSLSLALVIVLTIQFQLARWNAEIQIELLRTEIEDGLSAIKKCACGRRGCDGGCGH